MERLGFTFWQTLVALKRSVSSSVELTKYLQNKDKRPFLMRNCKYVTSIKQSAPCY